MKITDSRNIEAFLSKNNISREVLPEMISWFLEKKIITVLRPRQKNYFNASA